MQSARFNPYSRNDSGRPRNFKGRGGAGGPSGRRGPMRSHDERPPINYSLPEGFQSDNVSKWHMAGDNEFHSNRLYFEIAEQFARSKKVATLYDPESYPIAVRVHMGRLFKSAGFFLNYRSGVWEVKIVDERTTFNPFQGMSAPVLEPVLPEPMPYTDVVTETAPRKSVSTSPTMHEDGRDRQRSEQVGHRLVEDIDDNQSVSNGSNGRD